MKIAIVGAGVVGVATAYELAGAGHEVTVLERRSSAAEEASYAPGALMSPALLAPWAVPGAMGGPGNSFGHSSGMEVGSAARLAELRWLWQWRAAARSAAQTGEAPAGLHALAALSQLSRRRFAQTVQTLELSLEASAGALVLLRDVRTAAPLRGTVGALRGAGLALTEVDVAAAYKIEPGMAQSESFSMALQVPDALAANCRQFTVLLRQAAQRLGATFEFQSSVMAVRSAGARPEIQMAGGTGAARAFDAVVLCNGMDANALLGTLGIQLSMVALWGTSLTATLREDVGQPRGTVIDVARQVSLSRIGQRIRIAGGAELGRAATESHQNTLRRLYDALDAWFPGSAARGTGMQVWRGARAVRPGGLPALGASGVRGVWLNLAHGDAGWALASGCAEVLAHVIAGDEPPIGLQAMAHFAAKPPK